MFLLQDQTSVWVKKEANISSVALKSSFDTHERYRHNPNRANMQIKHLDKMHMKKDKKKRTHHHTIRLSYRDMHIYIRTHPKTFGTSYLRIVKIR